MIVCKMRYDVPFIKQGISECVQSSATEILQYLGFQKTLEQVKQEVPVYISSEGIPLGTSIGHMATYLTKQRLEVTAYLIGVELFDRSWKGKSSQELVEFLKQREPHVQSAKYEKEALRVIVDGYVQFLQAGGNIDFTPISSVFLQKLLQQGPVLAIVNYNFLNDVSKYIHNKQLNKPQQDSISGVSSSHMVVIAGYDVGKFLLLDPDFEFGGERWIDEDIVVGAIYLAEADFDGMVLTVQKK